MEQAKRIPYGVSNFVDIVERNQYYVDKTMYLPMLEDEADSLFFIRPRRFGKSLFISMMQAYYQRIGKIKADADVDAIVADMKPWYDNYCFSEDALITQSKVFNCDIEALRQGTQLHRIIMQFDGYKLHRLDEV